MTGSYAYSLIRDWHRHLSFRSILRYRNGLRRRSREPIAVTLLRPARMSVHIRPMQSDLDVLDEIFVKDVYGVVKRLVPDCRRIIDLGGNIGLAARYFGTAYPDSTILSVEPFSENIEVMRRNLGGLVSAGRCRILQAAAWDKNEAVEICRPKDPNKLCGLFVQSLGEPDDSRMSAPGLPMASILEASGFDMVDLVKIDIEGAERAVFHQADWLHQVRALAIEFHGSSRQEIGFDALMKRYGFRVLEDGNHTTVAVKGAPA